MLGLGIGLIIATIAISSIPSATISKVKIEKMAHDMGMKYPDELKAYFENDKNIKEEVKK